VLTELRASVRDALTAADVTAYEYMGEAFTPPCAVVVPSEPYVQAPGEGRSIPFGRVQVGIDVGLLVPRGEAKAEAAAIDALIEQAYRAIQPLNQMTIRRVSRPVVVTNPNSGSKYLGSVLTIEALAEEP
jgi:hypothetical protein